MGAQLFPEVQDRYQYKHRGGLDRPEGASADIPTHKHQPTPPPPGVVMQVGGGSY